MEDKVGVNPSDQRPSAAIARIQVDAPSASPNRSSGIRRLQPRKQDGWAKAEDDDGHETYPLPRSRGSRTRQISVRIGGPRP